MSRNRRSRARRDGAGPRVEEALVGYVRQARREGTAEHLLGLGAVRKLEARLCRHYQMPHAISVANATGGLLALALALNLRGFEVITTPLSWGGTIAGLIHAGARLVFADVDPVTLSLAPAAVQRAITPRTRAVLAVDLFGVPADQATLRQIATEHGLWYLHDGAQSLGAFREGAPAGSLADATVVSFTHGKTLDAGEGGAILTHRRDLYEHVLALTQHPYRQKMELGLTLATEMGLNMRINPLAAVWAAADFGAALHRLGNRRRHAQRVVEVLDESGLMQPLGYRDSGIQPTFSQITAAWARGPEVAELKRVLRDARLAVQPAELHLVPLYRHILPPTAAFRIAPGGCPIAEDQVRRRTRIANR